MGTRAAHGFAVESLALQDLTVGADEVIVWRGLESAGVLRYLLRECHNIQVPKGTPQGRLTRQSSTLRPQPNQQCSRMFGDPTGNPVAATLATCQRATD
jgi:hypothetical protein